MTTSYVAMQSDDRAGARGGGVMLQAAGGGMQGDRMLRVFGGDVRSVAVRARDAAGVRLYRVPS